MRSRGRAAGPLCALGAVLLIAAFHSSARVYYEGFRVPQGLGMEFPLPQELAHLSLFFVFGLPAMALLAFALGQTSIPRAAVAAGRALSTRPIILAVVCAAVLTVACLWIRREVLGGGVLSDDEHVYRFIAQTLRTGSLTARSPGSDLPFFSEQFVVTTETVRYGKYPVGFPLLLAAGQALGLEAAVVPALTGLLALLLAWVGLKAFSPGVVTVALVLFTLSPQVLVTGASLLSQPASSVCLMGALGCLLALGQGAPHAVTWAAGAGALLGYGIVVRPLPGVLFAAVAVAALAAAPRLGWRSAVDRAVWLGFLVPLACGPAAILWVNLRQSGHPFVSGYHAVHAAEWGPALVFHGTLARWAMAVASNVVRLNFWLFGWPLSLALCPFARRTPATLIFWGMIAAELAYRVIAPKAGIGTAGAIYFYEVVPLLCLLSADGLAPLAARAARLARDAVAETAPRPESLAAVVLAGAIVNLSLFLPFKMEDVARAGAAQQVVFRALRDKNVHHAVVFHRTVVPPWTGLSWAYSPPPNSPRLDDDILFVLFQTGPGPLSQNLEFWKRRFPDREAWFFGWDARTGPFLVPLTSYLSAGPPPSPAEGAGPR